VAAIMILVAAVLGCVEPGSREVILAKNDSPERQEVDVSYVLDGEEEQFLVRVPVGGSPGLRKRLRVHARKGS
jgi:hypothetical protein